MKQFVQYHKTLGDDFFAEVNPATFPATILRYRNDRAAKLCGIEGLNDDEWINHFGHFKPFEGTFDKPLALAYHGHQFGVYNPDIGDGRGFQFAQLTSHPASRHNRHFFSKGR